MIENWIIALAIFTVFALSILYVFYTWRRRRRFTRERFAFAAMTSIVILTSILFSTITGGPSHWDVVAGLIGITLDPQFQAPKPSWIEYITLGIVYWICVNSLSTFYHRWDGQYSERQHDMKQRQEPMPLLREGGAELLRVCLGRPALSVFSPQPHKLASQLQQTNESVAWRDRARSLVELRYPYFSFSNPEEWHDEAQCWIGRNPNTGDLVLLRCSPSDRTEPLIRSFVDYSRRIAAIHKQDSIKLILALQDDEALSEIECESQHVEIVTESSLLDQLVTWDEYRRDIVKRFSKVSLPDSELTVSDVFVQPHFDDQKEGFGHEETLKEYIYDWLHERGQRQLALLGDYGQGKSTAALALCWDYLTADDPARIPILVELRGTSPRNLTPLELFGAWASKYGIDPRSLYQLHLAGRLLIIFEGFDEMTLIGDSDMRLNHFKTLWEFCVPGSKILITGRPNFFFDEEEMVASLGISEHSAGRPYCVAIRLRPFNLEQIATALRAYSSNIRSEIRRFAAQNRQFCELISRPSLLHIVSVLWEKERLSDHLEKLTSAYLMGLFIRHSYLRQGKKENDSRDFMALTTEERQYFMKGVATYMAAKRLPNQIRGDDLNGVVAALVTAIPEAVTRRSSAIGGETRRPLQARIDESEHGLEHVQTDVRTSGILVDDPATPGTFRFGHKSFMEYLFSEVVADYLSNNERPDEASILNSVDGRPMDIIDLPVSVRFLEELLREVRAKAANSVTEQKRLSERILKLLLGDDMVRYAAGRHHLFRIAASRATEGQRWPARFFVETCVVNLTLLLPLLGAWLSGVALMLGDESNTTSVFSVFFIGAGATCVFLSIVILHPIDVLRLFLPESFKQRGGWRTPMESIAVWNQICKRLNIDDRVLFEVANIQWLPWTRNKSFDYFLKSDRNEDK